MKDFVKTLDDLPRIVKFILVLIGDLFANVYRLCPVSYTHLDVYKRQVWYSIINLDKSDI